jgi:serine/threonine protein phosphatase 1
MSIVQRFARNSAGRDFAVGDIHGHFTLLQAALDAAGFDPAAGDRLFSVGDLVDRGPESIQALEWIARPWFHAVQGNHEDMAIRYPQGRMDTGNYKANGGAWNVDSTFGERVRVSNALATLPVAIEVETARGIVGIVHADCPTPTWAELTASLEGRVEQTRGRQQHVIDSAQWSRARIDRRETHGVPDVFAVVVGHTPLKDAVLLGNVHFIDTGGWLSGGHFTVVDLATLRGMP